MGMETWRLPRARCCTQNSHAFCGSTDSHRVGRGEKRAHAGRSSRFAEFQEKDRHRQRDIGLRQTRMVERRRHRLAANRLAGVIAPIAPVVFIERIDMVFAEKWTHGRTGNVSAVHWHIDSGTALLQRSALALEHFFERE